MTPPLIDPDAPTADRYRTHHLKHRIGLMLCLLPILDEIAATGRKPDRISQPEFCAMKEGALIAMRSIMGLLGVGLTVISGDVVLEGKKPKDCPSLTKSNRDAIFVCRHIVKSDFPDGSPERLLLADLMAAGSSAVAHLTDKEALLDHKIDEKRLADGIRFLEVQLRQRVFQPNGWDWNEIFQP